MSAYMPLFCDNRVVEQVGIFVQPHSKWAYAIARRRVYLRHRDVSLLYTVADSTSVRIACAA